MTIPVSGRIIGLDAGERRLGVAISDPEQRLAVPLRTLDRNGREFMELKDLARSEEAAGFVVGLPLSLSGESGEQAGRARAFASEVEKQVNLPVAFWDERLSSQEADRLLAPRDRQGRRGSSRRPDKGATDTVAATIILQAYLDSRRGPLLEV